MNEPCKLLLVDDSPTNLEVLYKLLKEHNYKLFPVSSGERAISVAKRNPPDLVLLDIMMPGIDGFETCRRFKADDSLKEIPILFLSALADAASKAQGFALGANDFISKPFQKEELVARVKTHLELNRMIRENRAYAHEMEKLAQSRAEALVHAERLATLGTLSAGIAHEIGNPLTYISVAVQTLQQMNKDITDEPQTREARDTVVAELVGKSPDILKNLFDCVKRIEQIVSHLKQYARTNAPADDSCDVNTCVRNAIELTHNRLKYHTDVALNLDNALPHIKASSQLIEQVLVNLLMNAADAIEQKGTDIACPRGNVLIASSCKDCAVRVTIEDDGPGIPEASLKKIWEPFFTTKSSDKGTGLGLSIVNGIVKDLGGAISAENRPQGGALFTVILPALK